MSVHYTKPQPTRSHVARKSHADRPIRAMSATFADIVATHVAGATWVAEVRSAAAATSSSADLLAKATEAFATDLGVRWPRSVGPARFRAIAAGTAVPQVLDWLTYARVSPLAYVKAYEALTGEEFRGQIPERLLRA